jgi:predicted patatin/cPLA2 family phospholipase
MSIIEFDVLDFLDYFDDSFVISTADKKSQRDHLWNAISNELASFLSQLQHRDKIYKNTSYIEVNEREFILSILEIVESNDNHNLVNLEKLVKEIQNFTKRYRNITKTLDHLNTKIMKQDMKINDIIETEHCNFSIVQTVMDFSCIFTILGFIFYFIENVPHHQVECDTILGYGNETLNSNLF